MNIVAFRNVEYLLQFVIANKHFLVICKLKNCEGKEIFVLKFQSIMYDHVT